MAGPGLFLWMLVLLRVAPSGRTEFPVVGPRPVHAVVHDDVVLPCVLDPPFIPEDLTVDWTWDLTGISRFVHVFRNGEDDDDNQDEQFRGRTSMFHGEMSRGNLSLKLTNVTEEDSGLYSCHVPRLDSQVKDGNVNLSVLSVGDEHKTRDDSKDHQTIDYQTLAAICSVLGATVLILVLFCLCKKKGSKQPTKRRRKRKRNQRNTQDLCGSNA